MARLEQAVRFFYKLPHTFWWEHDYLGSEGGQF